MNIPRINGSILNELHHRFEALPKALGRVAQYVLTNPEKVATQSMAALSEQSGSGQASVVRLVQSLGFDRFSEFKTALSIELSRTPLQVEGDGGEPQQIANLLASATIADATETARLIGIGPLEEVAKHVRQSRRVWIFGSGIAGLCGELLEYRLLRLGIAATAIRDPILLRELADQLEKQDVAIAISDSGSTPHAVAFLGDTRQRGLFSVGISTRSNSALADQADALLQTGTTGGADKAGNVLGVVARNTLVIETLAQRIEKLGQQ
ncbi:MAG: MurR/RpiR family transcriptional regulator [Pseudomonadota bacterium]